MSITDIIDKLIQLRITIKLQGDNIQIEGLQENITSEILSKIRDNKKELIDFLESSNIDDNCQFEIPVVDYLEDGYELSSSQRRMWILNQFKNDNIAYNTCTAFVLEGNLNLSALNNAFISLLNRHEILRTIYKLNKFDVVRQFPISINDLDFNLKFSDFRLLNFETKKIWDLVYKEISIPFNLEESPLLRATVIATSENRYILLCCMHHIVIDQSSMEVFTRDLLFFYNLSQNSTLRLPTLKIQYRDYAVWQQKQLDDGKLDFHKKYWLNHFSGEIPVLDIPYAKKRPAEKKFNGNIISWTLNDCSVKEMRDFVKKTNSTLFMALVSAVNILFFRYTGQEDIIVGTPISGREHKDLENQLGLFLNILPLRTKLDGESSFIELFKTVRGTILDAFEHKNYPLDEILDLLNLRRDLSRNPLFDVIVILQSNNSIFSDIFNFNNAEIKNNSSSNKSIEEIKISRFEGSGGNSSSKFDLTFNFFDSGDSISATIEYDIDLFDNTSVKRMSDHLNNIFRSFFSVVDHCISSVNILGEVERELVVNGFNDTDKSFRKDLRIHELFEEQVRLHPDKIALEHGGLQMSYGLLNELSNQLAFYLRDKYGVGREDLVAIKMQKNEWIVICVLGILKLGSAYVPIDPSYPQERIEYILNDTGCRIILDESEIERFKSEGSKYGTENLLLPGSPEDLAYVIYTSGTTGKPKGVLVEHQGIINLIANEEVFSLRETDKVIQFASLSFDASIFEIAMALLGGSSLHIIGEPDILDKHRFEDFIDNHNITVALLPPPYLSLLDADRLSNLRVLFTGGSEANPKDVIRWKDKLTYVNAYGPTEGSVISTHYVIRGDIKEGMIIPIGRPIGNAQVYIINRQGSLQPVGIPGEICISGVLLARGYLNHPELTSEKFVENPFRSGERMYRTGDLGRWLEDGNIEFLGRIDDQVKIRGYRIEPQEVVLCLERKEGIRGSVVLNRGEGEDKYLCAYYVSDELIPVSELRSHVLKYLPDYMVPSSFVRIETIPLNSNGKVDRGSLPDPEFEPGVEGYQGAGNDTEREMIRIWSEVLKIPEEVIGVRSNFFELGGHSLRATILTGRIHKSFNVRVPLVEVFKTPTIRELSEYIVHANRVDYSVIRSVEKRRYYELSSAQKRLYIFQSLNPQETGYNEMMTYELHGSVDYGRLEGAFAQMVKRQEILRTSLVFEGEVLMQCVEAESLFSIERYEAEDAFMERGIVEGFVRPFDLGKAPLMREGLLRCEGGRHVLLIDMHHVITDGTSTMIFISELIRLYNGERLAPLRISYKDFAYWQNVLLGGDQMRRQQRYWLEQYRGEVPVLELPYDYVRPLIQGYAGDTVSFLVEGRMLEEIRELLRSEQVTLFMFVMSVYDIVLSKLSGQQDVVVGVPIAGRNHPELQEMLGMFVNTLAMRFYPGWEKSYKDFLAEVKQLSMSAYSNQDYPFEELVAELKLRRDTSRNALFDVMLVLGNFELSKGELSDMRVEGLGVSGYGKGNQMSKFDMTLKCGETADNLDFVIEYNTALFNRSTIERYAGYFREVMEEVLGDRDKKIGEISLMGEVERELVVNGFNNQELPFEVNRSVIEVFDEVVEQKGDSIAVEYSDVQITYRSLQERSAILSNYLLDGVAGGSGQLVRVMLDRGIDVAISILGILRSGGVYLPIDIGLPSERINYILKESGCRILITTQSLRSRHGISADAESIDLSDLRGDDIHEGDQVNAGGELLDLRSPSFIIYTSGSTGRPKGVVQTHLCLSNVVLRQIKRGGFERGLRVLQYMSLGFDASLAHEILFSFLSGGRLYFTSDDFRRDLSLLSSYIRSRGIEFLMLPSKVLNTLFDQSEELWGYDTPIRHLVSAGEQLNVGAGLEKYLRAHTFIRLHNFYGPSETHNATNYSVRGSEGVRLVKHQPIGVPASNVSIYILDGNQKVQPRGVPGEIYISGYGMFSGYINDADQTSLRVYNNPFRSRERMYRTGDLGRWLEDGNIEFLGRIDDQVKIRGYRIEPQEVVLCLERKEGIRGSVVLSRGEGEDKYLCAYYVSDELIPVSELRSHVLKYLPDYMVPSSFVRIETIPLNSNGKVDRGSLPDPEFEPGVEGYQGAGNDTEREMIRIWSEVLKIPEEVIGVRSNFFELGGHSLNALKLVSIIKRRFNTDISIFYVFKTPTIRELSEYIVHANRVDYSVIRSVEKRRYYELSSAQKRLYIFQSLNPQETGYN